jgi:hypothetical protein
MLSNLFCHETPQVIDKAKNLSHLNIAVAYLSKGDQYQQLDIRTSVVN